VSSSTANPHTCICSTQGVPGSGRTGGAAATCTARDGMGWPCCDSCVACIPPVHNPEFGHCPLVSFEPHFLPPAPPYSPSNPYTCIYSTHEVSGLGCQAALVRLHPVPDAAAVLEYICQPCEQHRLRFAIAATMPRESCSPKMPLPLAAAPLALARHPP
jgi:hypothetical protein